MKKILEDAGVGYIKLGKPTDERHILVSKDGATYQFGIDYMRDVWYSSSYLLDRKQSMNGCAKARFENYKMQPVEFAFMPEFKGKLLNTVSLRIVVPQAVSVRLSSVRRVQTVSAKWLTHSIWQVST